MKRTAMNLMLSVMLIALVGLIAGCGNSESTSSGGGEAETSPPTTATLPEGVMLSAEPAGPVQPVAELKSTAKAGDEVTVKVVIGGRKEPIIKQRTVMTVVDIAQSNQCYVGDDHCATPWDYCCDRQDLPDTIATVQIVDADGKPLEVDLTGAGLKPGQVLLVHGVVGPRPDPGTLVIDAKGLYIAADDPRGG